MVKAEYTESRADKVVRYTGDLIINTFGIAGAIDGVEASWRRTKALKQKERSIGEKAGLFGERVVRAFGRGVVTGVANAVAPAMYKNITYTEGLGWKVAKSFVAVPLDAANNIIFLASIPFTHVNAPFVKMGLNGVENALIDGAGHVADKLRGGVGSIAEKAHGATFGRFRRGRK